MIKNMFALHNSTDKHAVIIDNHLGLYETEKEAMSIYNRIGSIEESAHGSIQYIPPHYTCEGCLHESHDDIRNYLNESEDLVLYMDNEIKELNERVNAAE